MIKDALGNEYGSMEEYYNSPDLDDDLIYDYLAMGLRTPQNEVEKKFAKEGKNIILDGYDIDFE